MLTETARAGLVKGGAGVPSPSAQNLVNAQLKGGRGHKKNRAELIKLLMPTGTRLRRALGAAEWPWVSPGAAASRGAGCHHHCRSRRRRAHRAVSEGRAVPAIPMMGAEASYVSSEGNSLTKLFLSAVEMV